MCIVAVQTYIEHLYSPHMVVKYNKNSNRTKKTKEKNTHILYE